MWAKLAAFMGFNGVGDTALGIVKKIAGTDWSPEQEADFLLKYHAATKHLSVARRFIALAFMLGFAMFGAVWLLSGVAYAIYMWVTVTGETINAVELSTALQSAKAASLPELQNDIFMFLRDVFKEPMTWIVGFYFAIDLAGRLKK